MTDSPALTEAELAALSELADAATPGPWVQSGWLVKARSRTVCEESPDDYEAFHASVEFIAASREAIPRLIAEIRRLKGTP
jgi:hypothetical protein